MDPQIALHDLLAALESGDADEAIVQLESLTDWFERDGFLPYVDRDGDGNFIVPRTVR